MKTTIQTPAPNDALTFAPLRVVEIDGLFSVATREDPTPGSANNFEFCSCQHRSEAELFASAPAMLAALKWANECFSAYLHAETPAERDYYFKDAEHALNHIGEVIAKTEGKA